MKSSQHWGRAVVVAALLLLVTGGAAMAQLQSGNLYGTVKDTKGGALPGVTVTLTGVGAPQVQVTNAQGQFRFLSLPPATYSLSAQLEGYSTVEQPRIDIAVGRNTTIEVTLQAAIQETITVTTESPLLDERKISTGSTVSKTELEKIPTSRDPWAILQQVPQVLTDRINVGGNESGQQSNYVGPGSQGDQSVWAVDGVVITDVGALGSSPTYYDFDSFQEMQITTGGTDTSLATGGVTLNMVTKRGTNEWKGSARYLTDRDSWESKTSFDRGDLAAGGPQNRNNPQPPFKAGNRIVSVDDYGAEVGGPIVKDHLWIWGSYGRQKVSLLTVSDVSDKTDLESKNAKLNAQITSNNSATLFYLNGNKVKNGRNAGPTRPQETTWNQTGPTNVYKAEDTQIFSSNFYLTALYSHVKNGFTLAPQGGTGLNAVPFRDDGLVWHNSFVLYDTVRPQDQGKIDGSTFFNTGSVAHELKYGVGYRQAKVTSLSRWPGAGYEIGIGAPNYVYAVLSRDSKPVVSLKYTDFWAQDTLTFGNLTINAGIRYDRQKGHNDPSSVQANPVFPELLPAVNYPGADSGFTWTSVTPRLGLTYALGKDRKTLLRASYSRFADQLGSAVAAWLNPLYPPGYVYGYAYNNLGNGKLTHGDFVPNGAYGPTVNPVTKGLLVSNAVDPNLTPPKTDEVLLSVEHSLLPEFVIGLNLTYRHLTDLLDGERLVFDGNGLDPSNLNSIGRVATPNDYELSTIHHTPRPCWNPDGTSCGTLVYYELKPGITTRNGFFLTNGNDSQTYKGASFTFNKRLANRWSLRGNFSLSDWTWNRSASENLDPTITLPTSNNRGQGIQNGDQVVEGSGTGSGSKGNVYINSKWSYDVTGLYQIAPDRPWGFNVAANLYGRQGYPAPYFQRFVRSTISDNFGLGTAVLLNGEKIDTHRFPDVNLMDARIEKEFSIRDVGLTLGIDVFNVFNKSTILQRALALNRPTGNYVQEITSPRIFRIGARFSFR